MSPVRVAEHDISSRLAELVVHLTDCDPLRALQLVGSDPRSATGDRLEAVARAMVRLRHAPDPVPIDLREEPDGDPPPLA